MTEKVLGKLEEKVLLLMAELENSRQSARLLREENAALKIEKENNLKKLEGLITLLEGLEVAAI